MNSIIIQRYAKLRCRWLVALLVLLLGRQHAAATTIEFDCVSSGGDFITTSKSGAYYYFANDVYGMATQNGGASAPANYSSDVRLYANNAFAIYSDGAPITSVKFYISYQGKRRATSISCVDAEGNNIGDVSYDLDDSGLINDYIEWTGNSICLIITVGDRAIYGTDGESKAGQLCFSSMTIALAGGDDVERVEAPVFYPAACSFYNPIEVEIATVSDDCSIRYTTDGSDPSASVGTAYTAPIAISKTTTIKAVAINGNGVASAVASATYTCTKHGIGEDYDPSNPADPQVPEVERTYRFNLSSVPASTSIIQVYHYDSSIWSTRSRYPAGTQVYVEADINNSNFKFTGWTCDGQLISESAIFYYTMPDHDVELVATVVYDPSSPADPSLPVVSHPITVNCSPSAGGSVYTYSNRALEGEEVYVYANTNTNWEIESWIVNGETIESTNSELVITMEKTALNITCKMRYNPGSPSNPSSNYWNPETGELIMDDFRSGNLYSDISTVLKGDSFSLVKSITIVGNLNSNQLSCFSSGYFPNLITLNLSKATGLTKISNYGFENGSYSALYLPSCLESMGNYVLYGCNYLTQLTVYAKVPPTASKSTFYNFNSINSCVLMVPKESVDLYKAAEGWKDFFMIEEIPTLIDTDEWQALCDLQAQLKAQGWTGNWKLAAGPDAVDITALTGVSIANGHVIGLDLSSQGISGAVPEQLCGFPQLITLNLSGNALTGDVAAIADMCPSLQRLDVTYNLFTEVSHVIPAAVELYYNHQKFSAVIDFDLRTLNATDVAASIPSIGLYDHPRQKFTSDYALTMYLSRGSAVYDIKGDEIAFNSCSYSANYSGQSGDEVSVYIYPENGYGSFALTAILSFDMGDANFDGHVNVLDLQSIINHAFDYYDTAFGYVPFNVTAANLRFDENINVQDVVLMVNLLLESDIDTANGMRSPILKACRTDALAYCEGGKLWLSSAEPVAAFDITVANCDALSISNTLKSKGFTVSTSTRGNITRIVAYSLVGSVIDPGVITIADVDDQAEVQAVMLSDIHARGINSPCQTSMSADEACDDNISCVLDADGIVAKLPADAKTLSWRVYAIDGSLVSRGTIDNAYGAVRICSIAEGAYVVMLKMNGNVSKVLKLKN